MTTNEKHNGTAAPDLEHCKLCGHKVADLQHLHGVRQLKQAGPSGKPEPTDPVIGLSHETCALRHDVQQLQAQLQAAGGQANQATALLIAIVTKLGGSVRFHQAELKQAVEQHPPLDIKQELGGFLTVELRRSIIVPPTTLV